MKRKTMKRKTPAPAGTAADRGREAHHEAPIQLGGSKKRLPVLEPLTLPPDFEFKSGVPPTPAHCKTGPRPCPYIRCEKHMWLVEQHDRPGNPSKGAQGATTIAPLGESCQLDVSKRGPLTLEQIGNVMGMTPTRVHQIYRGATNKFLEGGGTIEGLRALVAEGRS